MVALHRGWRGRLRAVQPAGGGQAVVQQVKPAGHALARRCVHERGHGGCAVTEDVLQLHQGEAADAHAGRVGQGVGVGEVLLHTGHQRRNRLLIDACDQLLGGRRGEELVEENLQAGVGDCVQAQGRFAHFAHARAQGGGVLGAEVAMQAESHF